MERGQRDGHEANQRDRDWVDEGVAWQWEMPEKAGHFWRRRGVRHLRALATLIQAYIFTDLNVEGGWNTLWRLEWTAYAIRRGWC
jgi:hypothetical protein